MYKADLHLHTTSSDGLFTPTEVVEWAAKKKLNAIAITDHDTVDGIAEALEAGDRYGLEVIPGIELSCTYRDEEIHVLGYFIDGDSKPLVDKISELKEARENRGNGIVENLIQYGLDITAEEVMEKVQDGAFGRPHIARVLVEKGIVDSMEEAFNNYLVKGKIGYVERYKITVKEAIDLIHISGGVAVMAHPGIAKNRDYPKEILRYGFDGIEVVHSAHDESTEREYTKIADKLDLIKTAGSDCHGVLEDGNPMLGEYTACFDSVEKLKAKRDEIRLEAKKHG